ncbi:NAC domain-containing protein 35-like [Iris pallida]|uniref:NAC domain-containing protein 35-like n=1 Tax=Iris pallida TaxID=29817 RepID=A0AAX6ENL3_IRIPA|nr:NAC domain-containing protein 35-like [Iris pallida]
MATVAMNGGRLGKDDDHENDLVMPGFRFHPTEEELVEFYLRRKVEGKRFNVELITFLDLYRYDPWELPALATIGEKEWFFYVPRDRKYRNGDRPNRVTTSGYWKATGADRVIRGEDSRSIGLKKTLVFYSGKAPKGIRTCWIMNEYRLPQIETDRSQKAEISLCRVHKRAGIEDHHQIPCTIPNIIRPTPSSLKHAVPEHAAAQRTSPNYMPALGGGDPSSPSSPPFIEKLPPPPEAAGSSNTKHDIYPPTIPMELDVVDDLGRHPKNAFSLGSLVLDAGGTCADMIPTVGELDRVVSYNVQSQLLHPLPPQAQLINPLDMMPANSDKLWEWNLESGKDYINGFK